jgi:hypothetical protein
MNLLVQKNIADSDALNDKNSSQGCAFEWITNDPIILKITPGSDDDRIIQRFVLAVLFCATKGTEWDNNGDWLTGSNECTWLGIGCEDSSIPSVATKLGVLMNGLQGTIPSELGTLNRLGEFSFWREKDECVFTLQYNSLMIAHLSS